MKKIFFTSLNIVIFSSPFYFHNAIAATVNGTLGINAIVGSGCQINSGTVTGGVVDFGNLDFGSINTLGAPNIDGQTSGAGAGSIAMECSSGTSFSITLDNGQNFANGTRSMANTTDNAILLNYALYQNVARTIPWTTSSPLSTTSTGVETTYDVYGRIPGNQAGITAGTYNDTVQVVISW